MAAIMKRAVYVYGLVSRQSPNDYNIYRRHLSQIVNPNRTRDCLTDTLAVVKSLETQGVPSNQAEAITSVVTNVLNGSLENVYDTFVSKAEMEKLVKLQEAHISKFKFEIQSCEDNHFSMLKHDLEKMQSDLSRHIHREIYGLKALLEASDANQTKEMYEFKAQLETTKYDIIKYCIYATLISTSAIGLAVVSILHKA